MVHRGWERVLSREKEESKQIDVALREGTANETQRKGTGDKIFALGMPCRPCAHGGTSRSRLAQYNWI